MKKISEREEKLILPDFLEINSVEGYTRLEYGQYYFNKWVSNIALINLSAIIDISKEEFYGETYYKIYLNTGARDCHSINVLPDTYDKIKQYLNYISITNNG